MVVEILSTVNQLLLSLGRGGGRKEIWVKSLSVALPFPTQTPNKQSICWDCHCHPHLSSLPLPDKVPREFYRISGIQNVVIQ